MSAPASRLSPARKVALISAPLLVGAGLLVGFTLRVRRAPSAATSANAPVEATAAPAPRQSGDGALARAVVKTMQKDALSQAPAGELVTSDADEPVSITVDEGGRLFWADARRGVLASAERDGDKPRVLAERLFFSKVDGTVALDEKRVYWTSGGRTKKDDIVHGVFFVAKTGGPSKQIAAARSDAGDLVVSGEVLFWLDREGDPKTAPATLLAVLKDGGELRSLATLGPACALTADAEHLYWIELGAHPAVKRADFEAHNITTLAPANGAACSLAMSGPALAWVRPRNDQVLAVEKAGGDARVVTTAPSTPSRIRALKSGFVVATDMFPGKERLESVLYLVHLDDKGGAPRPIAHAGRLSSLATHDDTVWWTSFDDGGAAIRHVPAM